MEKNDPYYKKYLRILFSVLCISYFGLNILGLPILSINFILLAVLALVIALTFDFESALPYILVIWMIEGQGRILLNNNLLSKMILDVICGVAALRLFMFKKSLIPSNVIPHKILALVGLHFAWFVVEMFNVNGVSLLGLIATSKIYLAPIIVFFALCHNDYKKNLETLSLVALGLIVANSIVAIYQMPLKEDFILGISPAYLGKLRGTAFIGNNYRPFGFSFGPGASSIYYYTIVPLIFMQLSPSTLRALVSTVGITLGTFILFISQVRSAFAKFTLEIFFIFFVLFNSTTKKIKIISLTALFIPIVLISASVVNINVDQFMNDFDLQKSFSRLEEISSVEEASAKRLTVDTFFIWASQLLGEHPLGLGPGRTGGASAFSAEETEKDPLYATSKIGWAGDNLFISLIIELGWGFIFYTLLICSIPFSLAIISFNFYQKRMLQPFRITSIAFVTTAVMLLGQWGVLGIPYNPESLIYWLFGAIGLKTNATYNQSNL